VVRKGIWYRTQKEHWLGWLSEYNTQGAYGRIPGKNRDAKYAYNHIANAKMLLWLIGAAGVDPALVRAAKRDADRDKSMNMASAAIRRRVPWDALGATLWAR